MEQILGLKTVSDHLRYHLMVSTILLLCLATTARAEQVVVEEVRPGVEAFANYWKGEADKPALVLVHGLFQTSTFPTVRNLGMSLAEEGYTVLLPTVSLGINRRSQSLSCDAIHSHDLKDDNAEITYWLDWLSEQGHEKIVLMGHSQGALTILRQMLEHPHPAVKHLVPISLVDMDWHLPKASRQVHRGRAKSLEATGGLARYRLFYCQDLVAAPVTYLSYTEWGNEQIISALQNSTVPVTVVLGGQDRRMRAIWPRRLIESGSNVLVSPGANHFFDGMHEFALFETVIDLLEGH